MNRGELRIYTMIWVLEDKSYSDSEMYSINSVHGFQMME